jgi:hypothetical protein
MFLETVSHMHDSWQGVMHPWALKIYGKILEHVVWHEETLIFYMSEPSVHPDEVVRVKDIIG